ncbi:MAG TPA: glycosyltransferase family 39 protein [Chloroflexota bacterium]|nr:glycosyltransferase family 39 protein [Chloroflexota bacterium]
MRRIGGLWAAVTVLLLAAAFLRVFRLDLQAATGDDAFSLMIAQHSLGEIVQLAKHELHPPLFYFILHFWQMPAGTSEFAGRYLAAGFGVLAVAAMGRLGLALGGRGLMLAGLLLASINPFLIDFAQQVRAYPQMVGLLAISIYLQCRLLQRPTRGRWVAYSAVTALALYSHLFAFFVLLAEDVVFLILALRRQFKAVIPWVLSQLAIGLAYVPWLAVDSAALQSYGNDMVRAASLPAMAASLVPTFVSGLGSSASSREIALVLALVASGLLLWRLLPSDKPPEDYSDGDNRREAATAKAGALGLPWRGYASSRSVLLLACWLLVPVLAVWAISFSRPIFYERYMVIILPAFLLLAAAGALEFSRVWTPAGVVLLVVLCAPSIARLPGYYGKVVYASTQDIHDLLAFVRDSAQPNAAFVVNLPPSDPMYQYYAPAEPTYFIPNPAQGQQPQADQQLGDVLASHGEVWLTPWDYDHTAFVEHWLDQHAFRVDQHWFSNAEIIRYERPQQGGQLTPSDITFVAPDAQIRITGYQFFGTDVRVGQPILFALQWQASGPIAERYKVFAHLVDPQGRTVTQRDDEPVANTRPTTSWKPGETIADNYGLVVPRGAPAGAYQVYVGLYRAQDLQRLKLTDGADHAVLGPISVRP